MATLPPDPSPNAAFTDGTSQSGRLPRWLDPAAVPLDERDIRAALGFVRAYARELNYFDADNQLAGDWSGLLGASNDELDLDAAAGYALHPELAAAGSGDACARPHVALLLVFLRLLDRARERLNAIPGRHLDFFYRDMLHMVGQRGVADRVHVLVDLDPRTAQLRLPAGTVLVAGKDSLGRELAYRTEADLTAQRAQVAQVCTTYASMRVTGLEAASKQYQTRGNRNDAFLAMLRIALGQPNPGDPLPVPIYPGVPAATAVGMPPAQIGFDTLQQAQKLVNVVGSGLFMPLFDDFRLLMRLRQMRHDGDAAGWATVNGLLMKTAGRRAALKGGPVLTFPQADDFDANLRAALNIDANAYAHLYDGLPEVKSIEEAYAASLKPERDDVRSFIEGPKLATESGLYLSQDEFKALMQAKMAIDNGWSEITRLLDEAGRRKRQDPSFAIPDALRGPRGFDAQLTAALGTPDYAGASNLDSYFADFLAVERYFYMPAEQFSYLMSVATTGQPASADDPDWRQVYAICAAAHAEMIFGRRRQALLAAAQPAIAAGTNVPALQAMCALALGEVVEVADALALLPALGVPDDDQKYLGGVAAGTVVTPDWQRVASVLEIAQRNRENFQAPVAEKLEWFNLYPQADARSASVVAAAPGGGVLPRWKPFGAAGGQNLQPAPDPNLGWAICSPLLTLSEGTRTIAIALGFAADPTRFDLDGVTRLLAPTAAKPGEASFNPFVVQLSGEKAWIDPSSVSLTWTGAAMQGYPTGGGIDPTTMRTLVLTLTLAPGLPALVRPNLAVHGLDAAAPTLRILLRPWWNADAGCYQTAYQTLRRWLLVRAQMAVMVVGLSHLRLRNDAGPLDPKKPFEPFGTSPAAGARLYIGHPELASKKLDAVKFRYTWMGAPAKLADQYVNYPGGLTNTSFTANVGLADRGVYAGTPASMNLFDAATTTGEVSRGFPALVDRGTMAEAAWAAADVGEWTSHIVWELVGDFQHPVYPTLALQKSLQLAASVAKGEKPDAAAFQINPPYTPKIKSLLVDYQTTVKLPFDSVAGLALEHPVFHLHPFGSAPVVPDDILGGSAFLPGYEDEGDLYIGLARIDAPQNLDLLFQVAEGSANPDAPAQALSWSYLSDNRWLTLQDGGLLADASRGLINSGIARLSLKPALPSTLMPAGLYWLRVGIARASDSVCDLVDIHPNAVSAVFEDRGNAADHLSRALPPGSVKALAAPLPGLARVRQPYSSFGGKMPEAEDSFRLRVSERLRHKQRALTPWDYERLLLAKFPQLHKVKCLRADPQSHPGEPGRIDLIVIPDIRDRFPFNPFEPKAPADLIRDIADFLRDKTPPLARVSVQNARFVALKVRVGVRFMPGEDEGYSRQRLNDELNRFLSPWAYEEGADLVIGGRIYASSIIDFIESRPEVDYVAELKLFTDETGVFKLIPPEDGYHAGTSGPDGILVAAPEHEFDLISDADYRVDALRGIDYMKVELDFIVA